ncbi:MAG: MBL fold metallo-hydrolase [Methylobacteriaceae bacterium]|nr:MBL fold metallo-hydrolase [Methylobacteriaceae bacterium]MBV9245056.1 MBL fold metallo-hydrolase [Methylobacteriaceae bacterium]
MSLTITILGCGSSGGVPRVGQGWGACDPTNPKNRRRRCSILVERAAETDGAATNLLVDTSPDLRDQLLDTGVARLDGIVLTHLHADHTHGIDDVRPLVIHMRRRIDVFMDAVTSAVVSHRFDYIFQTPPGSQYPAICNERRIVDGQDFEIAGPGGAISVTPFRLDHGDIDAMGLRFGACAYTPDVIAIPEASRRFLVDLDLWIIDALRYARHPTHLSLAEALEWIDRLKPRRAVLTNMHTDLDYEGLRQNLPAHIEPAYDGMRLSIG